MPAPVEMDGGMGEGGGQVLRLSVALAAATGRPLRITRIRAGRRRPGLRAQHVAAVRAVAALCDAEVEGLEIGSGELGFAPSSGPGGTARVDVGTAGSVTLVLQAALAALSAPGAGPAEVTVRGGTDVMMAPAWDYLARVLAPALGRMGLDLDMSCQRRGFFPRGGGVVTLSTEGRAGRLRPYRPEVAQDPVIEGSVVYSQLPDHIPRRIDHALREGLAGLPVERVRKKHVEADGPGVAATVWADLGGAVVGASAVGRRGLPSERMGGQLAAGLLADLRAGATADVHLADQLVAHAALAGGTTRVAARELSLHARTAMDVASAFVDLGADVVEEVPDRVVLSMGRGDGG